jgi:aminomethyltransferase
MKTCLFDHHLKLNAKLVNFEGFEMPINYDGAIKEHGYVRESAGIFDISHMARIEVEGEGSEDFLNFISVNDVLKLENNQAQYTVLCDENGMSLDDILIYKKSQKSFFVVVNASNRQHDLTHFKKHSKKYDVKITPYFEGYGILAIQGPKSKEILSQDYPEINDLKFMRFFENNAIVSQTGYTGEIGYEIYADNSTIVKIWEKLLSQSNLLHPIGLAARDILRLEMGYALYGHELSDQISPLESVASWVVRLNKPSFLGKEALLKIKENQSRRSAYGIVLSENAIARAETGVYLNEEKKGFVTSGIYSPSLKRSIALILVDERLNESQKVQVLLRNRMIDGEVVKLPFLKK